jgi:hypothetical protein
MRMNPKQIVQRCKIGFDVYLLYIALATLVIGWHNTHTQIGWTLGDWLINYRGGFVRRGLVGELIFPLSGWLHLSPLYIAVAIVLLLYAVVWFSVRELLSQSSWSLWIFFAVLSPATLAFGILDDRAGFHKEILFLASLGLLLLLLKKNVSGLFLTVYLTIACAACVLSHEPLFVYMPYYLAAVLLGNQSWRRALSITAIPFLTGLVCFYAAAKHPGNQDVATRICTSLADLGPSICDGAIDYISHDSNFARQELLAEMHRFHYIARYPFFAVLSLIPIVWGFYSLWKQEQLRNDLRNMGALSLVSMIGSTVLFFYATDWGRWIYIHVFSLFLLLLFLSSYATGPSSADARSFIWLQPKYRARAVRIVLLLLLYTCFWNMPSYGDHPAYGYGNLLTHFVRHSKPNLPTDAM